MFNGERFLGEAIAGLLAQRGVELELLVADNASTDRSLAIARRFAADDGRVTVLTAPLNRGAAWNFNRLVSVARAPYFAWAADDDGHRPDYLARCVAALEAAPEAVLAFSRAVEVDEEGRQLARRGALNVAGHPSPVERFRAQLFDERYCYAVFGVVRRDVLVRTGGIGAFTNADRVLLAELALHGRFVECDEELFVHREHRGRSMRSHPDDRDRMGWFAPQLDGSWRSPRWRLGLEYRRALARAASQLSAGERRAAQRHLARWVTANRSPLARELLRAAPRMVGRP